MKILKNLIVFEGIDGAGTTTQAQELAHVYKTGFDCEPTNGKLGRLIRRCLKGEDKVSCATLARLFAADRRDHLYSPGGLVDRCKEGVVICDRYLFSSLAYQSLDVPGKFISELNKGFPLPEVTFFIDVSVETALKRLSKRSERELYETEETLNRVVDNYKATIQKHRAKGYHTIVLDGTKSIEEVHKDVVKCLKKRSKKTLLFITAKLRSQTFQLKPMNISLMVNPLSNG